MDAETAIQLTIDGIVEDAHIAIEENDYEGIRDQDGWETLQLTVEANHERLVAGYILHLLNRFN